MLTVEEGKARHLQANRGHDISASIDCRSTIRNGGKEILTSLGISRLEVVGWDLDHDAVVLYRDSRRRG